MIEAQNKKRILTGDNATGKLHVGHFVGSLANRVRLQEEYETFIIIADMHSLAYPKYVGSPNVVSDAVLDVAMDNLAVGLDPKRVHIFTESAIPEIYELSTIFSMLVSHNRALRNPTLKEEIRDKNMGDNYSMGFVNFPILQAADILGVKANLVPVGEDQLPHIELTREIAKRFNSTYGEVFPEPEALVGEVKRLVGTDGGAKMTKSLGNTIYLDEPKDSLHEKIMNMYTDPKRIHATDPGTVEGNPVFIYHDAFNSNRAEVEDLKARYRDGKVGDIEVKEKLFVAMNGFLEPIRDRRSHYEKNPSLVVDIIKEGNKHTREIVRQTLDETAKILSFRFI